MDVMYPLYKYGVFNYDFSLAVAFIIGISFGFFLERGGLGNARKLAAQFYLTDLTVFKVMFTAIITAMLGLYWLSWFGIVDESLVYLNPTYIIPQLIAGLLFGIGFVVAGLCPGTSCVALVTGKLDGLATLFGIFTGIFVYAELFPFFKEFHFSTSLGSVTLSQIAKNITLKDLPDLETRGIRQLVLYNRGDSVPKEAIELLIKKNVEVFILKGGMEQWKKSILFPDLSYTGIGNADVEWLRKVSLYFGGDPFIREKRQPESSRKFRREGC